MGPLQNLGSPTTDSCRSPVLHQHQNGLWYGLTSMIGKKEKRGSGKPRQICSQAQFEEGSATTEQIDLHNTKLQLSEKHTVRLLKS